LVTDNSVVLAQAEKLQSEGKIVATLDKYWNTVYKAAKGQDIPASTLTIFSEYSALKAKIANYETTLARNKRYLDMDISELVDAQKQLDMAIARVSTATRDKYRQLIGNNLDQKIGE
jgi:hypothetical protein